MDCLSKADILGADDRRPIRVDVPEWGGVVYVRPLSGVERDELEAWQAVNKGGVGLRAKVASLVLCDAAGASLEFSEDEVDRLGERSAAALARVLNVASEASGLGAAAVEEAAKN